MTGFYTQTGKEIKSSKIILTTGTFLNGLIHIGEERTPAGRFNEKPSTGLSEQLKKYNFKIGRLKTGTPPRLDSRTINFNNLEEQHADEAPCIQGVYKVLDQGTALQLKTRLSSLLIKKDTKYF